MAIISKEEFLRQQQDRAERSARGYSAPPVSYFSLKGDGNEAVVRFAYSDVDEMYDDIITTHPGTAETKWRRINCLNDLKAGVTNCPLCESGNRAQQRFFIRLTEYVRNDDGSISSYARVWDRPTSFIQVLVNLFAEYGDISDSVFKIKRSGEGLDTRYNVLFCNPQIYNGNLYPKDFSAFNGYNIIGGQVLDKSFEELQEMVGGETTPTNQTFTPSYEPTTQYQPFSTTVSPKRLTY